MISLHPTKFVCTHKCTCSLTLRILSAFAVVVSDFNSVEPTVISRGKCHRHHCKPITIMCFTIEIIVGVGVGAPLLLLLIIFLLCSSLVTYLCLTRGRQSTQQTTTTVQNTVTTTRSARESIQLQSNTAYGFPVNSIDDLNYETILPTNP